jgi:hypothetical protein
MKLTPQALEAIKNKEIRLRLATMLNKTEQTINNYIKNNDPVLTQASVLKFIKEQTGLAQSKILVAETEEA